MSVVYCVDWLQVSFPNLDPMLPVMTVVQPSKCGENKNSLNWVHHVWRIFNMYLFVKSYRNNNFSSDPNIFTKGIYAIMCS